VAKGFRKTKTMGVRQIRRCRSCGRKFTPKYQKARVAAGHKPKSSVRSVPAAAKPSGTSSLSAADEWWKLNEDADVPRPADESEPVLPL
jgi:hypothetical protein